MSAVMIGIADLTFYYRVGEFRLEIPELSVARGETVAIIGPSGTGKTTLLNLIAGIIQPQAGRVVTDQVEVTRLGDAQRRALRIAHIGLVFQEFEILTYLSVLDNILLPYRINPAMHLDGKVRRRAVRLAGDVGIGDKLQRNVSRLSQGERQRVAVCRAILPEPKLILADEPGPLPGLALPRAPSGEDRDPDRLDPVDRLPARGAARAGQAERARADDARVSATGLARAIPLYTRFHVRGHTIVGTSLDYFGFRTLQIAEGRALAVIGECVLGAEVGRRLGAVPGVLRREGTNIVANASVLQYNEVTPDNIDSFHFHGDPNTFPITAVIAVPHDAKSSALLQGRYLGDDELVQIVRPIEVMDELLQTILTVQSFVVTAVVIVGLATLATATLVFMLSLRLRRREIETMVKIGGSRASIFAVLATEIDPHPSADPVVG